MNKQEKIIKGMREILAEDLIKMSITHENPPPGKDCEEECGVDALDLIAAANPICSPMRSDGKKHKKCMDCWNEYIDSLILRLLTKQASQGVVIRGNSLGVSHPHLVNYYSVEPLIGEVKNDKEI